MSSSKSVPPPQPTHDEISLCAYVIWLDEGRPDGRDKEHWYQAETQLNVTRAHEGWIGETDHTAHHSMTE
jgi:hypothetical protein